MTGTSAGTASPASAAICVAASAEAASAEAACAAAGHPGGAGPIRVRRAVPQDRAALTGMFERCSSKTRYRRFHGRVNVLPERYLAEALSGSPVHYALVACAVPDPASDPALAPGHDPGPGGIVALASCRVIAEGAAELGFLVEDAWQRRGIGGALLRELLGYASRAGLCVLTAQLLAEQAWIARRLRRYGPCQAGGELDGVFTVSLRLRG